MTWLSDVVMLKERWSGRAEGETISYIAAEVYSPCQPELMTEALRIATGSETCIHPRDWPPHPPIEQRRMGKVWPKK